MSQDTYPPSRTSQLCRTSEPTSVQSRALVVLVWFPPVKLSEGHMLQVEVSLRDQELQQNLCCSYGAGPVDHAYQAELS